MRRLVPTVTAVLALVASLAAIVSPPVVAGSPPRMAAGVARADCGCTGAFVAPTTKAPATATPAIEDDGSSPTGRYHLTAAGPDSAGNVTLTVVEVETGSTVLTVSAKATNWGFSPDDSSLAVWGGTFGELWSIADHERLWRQDGVGAAYLFSPRGGFLVEQAVVSGIPRIEVVDTASGHVRQLQGFTNLGFGKVDDRLAVWSATAAQLWDLTAGKVLWRDDSSHASALGFSPDGGNLEVQQVTATTHDSLRIVRTSDGTVIWSDDFIFVNPPTAGATPIGDAGGGFSPDGGAFVEAYRSTAGVTWRVVDLADGDVVATESITQSSAFWRFSPCGDVIGLVQPSGISLVSTTTGSQVGSHATGTAAYVVLSATSTSYVATVDGVEHVLAPNGAGKPCPSNVLASLTLPAGDLRAGSVTGKVTLQKAAQGATTVLLSSSGADATVPASVTVEDGETSATFTASVAAVAAARSVTVTARLGSSTKTGTLHLVPPRLVSVTTPVDTVAAHNELRLEVELDSEAPAGGLTLAVKSSDPELFAIDPTVTVEGGHTTGGVIGTAGAVMADDDVDLTVTAGGVSRRLTIHVQTLRVVALELPDRPVSSDTASIPAAVTLNGYAPPGGLDLAVATDRPAVLAAPAQITVAAGERSAELALTPTVVTEATSVEVTATTGSAAVSESFDLLPPVEIADVTSDDDTVSAGQTGSLRVTLDRGWNDEIEGDTKSVAVSISPSRPVGNLTGRWLAVPNADDSPHASVQLKFGFVAAPTDVVVTLTLAGKARTFTFRLLPPAGGTLFTAAGGGRDLPSAEPKSPLEVTLNGVSYQSVAGDNVRGLAVDRDGAAYVRYAHSPARDAGATFAIARIDDEGITQVADTDGQEPSSHGAVTDPWGGQIDVGPDRTVYVAGGARLTTVSPDGSVEIVPGTEGIGDLEDVAVDHAGTVYAADWENHRILRIQPGSDHPETVVDDDRIGRAYLDVGPDGTLVLGDLDRHLLLRVTTDGEITTIAGTGQLPPEGTTTYPTYRRATEVAIDRPNPTALPGGAVAFSDRYAVYVVDPRGYLRLAAGDGRQGTSGDGYPADYPGAGLLSRIAQVAIVGNAELLVADSESSRVRQVHLPSTITELSPFLGQEQEHDFGVVSLGDRSEPLTLTYTNVSDSTIAPGLTRLIDDDEEAVPDVTTEDDTCAVRAIRPDETCSVTLRFAPGGIGDVAADLRIGGPGYTVATLRGSSPSPVTVSPETLDFGDVEVGATSPAQTLVATNDSPAPVTLDNEWDLPDGVEVVTDECAGTTLPPDGQCTVGLRVTPPQLSWDEQQVTLSGPGPVPGRAVPYVAVTVSARVTCPEGSRPNGGTSTNSPQPTTCVPTGTPSGTPTATPSDDPSEDPTGSPSGTPSGTPTLTPSGTPTLTPGGTPSTSAPVLLKEQRVTAKAPRRRVTKGSRITVRGAVSPGRAGASVRLEQYVGGRWVPLRFTATVHRVARSRLGYVLRFRPRRAGRYLYRVWTPATTTYASAASRPFRVTVRH